MAITVSSFITPKAGNTWFILEDKYIKGGLHVVADATERDAINPINKKAGMVVIQQSDSKLYQLQSDLISYQEVKLGGGSKIRQTVTHVTQSLAELAAEDITLSMGRSVILYNLSVDHSALVEAHSVPGYVDTNPYKFVASNTHLQDDGQTTLNDGTVVYGRRYAIVANNELTPSSNIYWRVTNLTNVTTAITLQIEFLPLEDLP